MSTVFVRMMMERGDFLVVHEPFSNFAALGYFQMSGERVVCYDDLVGMLLRHSESGTVFFKDTTEYRYPEVLNDPRVLKDTVNTFIIRDPAEAIASHYAVNPDLTLEEAGYENLFEIFSAVRRATGTAPAVIAAQDLVADPAATIRAYCERVGMPFRPEALNWQAGERAEWERTARWHREVNESTGVRQISREYAVRVDNDEGLAAIYRHHLPFYEKMRDYCLTPG